MTPLSGLSIALVISVQSLYSDTGLAWIVTAVIGGSILTEFLVTRTGTPERPITHPSLTPVSASDLDDDHPAHLEDLHDLDDERDAPDGPIYRDDAPPPAANKPKPGGGH